MIGGRTIAVNQCAAFGVLNLNPKPSMKRYVLGGALGIFWHKLPKIAYTLGQRLEP